MTLVILFFNGGMSMISISKRRLAELIVNELGEDTKICKVDKPNVGTLFGIVRKDTATACIYVDDFYDAYCQEKMSLIEICNQIASVLNGKFVDYIKIYEFQQNMNNFEYIKDKLRIRLVNKERNLAYLQKYIWKPFLDLAAIPYIEFNEHAANIDREMLKVWNVNSQEIFDIAMENCKENVVLIDSVELMKQLLGPYFIINKPGFKMTIVSNISNYLGAGMIVCPDILEAISNELGGSYYIFPASIHECMVMPGDITAPKEKLKKMVQDINRTEIDITDFLSDSLYFYDSEKKEISIKGDDELH